MEKVHQIQNDYHNLASLGMSETEIQEWCNDKNILCARKSGYWTAEIYSFGKYIREYGFYPDWLPLCVQTDHGPNFIRPAKNELECDAPVQFYHWKKNVEEWKKLSKKPCYTLYSPFVYYRRSRGVKQDADAKGTLAYPAHSTPDIDDEADYEEYIDQLMSLPKEFHPIAVQLHVHDINKGMHKLFMKHRIPVYTAGHYADYRFAERFYSILKRFRYTTSNMIMSCLFYSVEMGIPHFLYGISPKYFNKGDSNYAKGYIREQYETEQYRKIESLFRGIHTEITDEQKALVEETLGVRDGISRYMMSYILYRSMVQHYSRVLAQKVKKAFAFSRTKSSS